MSKDQRLGKSGFFVPIGEEYETDIVDLLTAVRVVNSEMMKITQSPQLRAGIRLVVNQLLDLALEQATGGEVIRPRDPPDRTFDELQY